MAGLFTVIIVLVGIVFILSMFGIGAEAGSQLQQDLQDAQDSVQDQPDSSLADNGNFAKDIGAEVCSLDVAWYGTLTGAGTFNPESLFTDEEFVFMGEQNAFIFDEPGDQRIRSYQWYCELSNPLSFLSLSFDLTPLALFDPDQAKGDTFRIKWVARSLDHQGNFMFDKNARGDLNNPFQQDRFKEAITNLQRFWRVYTPEWITEPKYDKDGDVTEEGERNMKIYQYQDEHQEEFWDNIQEINLATAKLQQIVIYIRSTLYPSEFQNMESPGNNFFNYIQSGFKQENPQLAEKEQGDEKKGIFSKLKKPKVSTSKAIDNQSPYRIENRKMKKIEKKLELYDLIIEYHERGCIVWADEILYGDLEGQRNYLKIYSSVFNTRFVQELQRSMAYIDDLLRNNEKMLSAHIVTASMSFEQKALETFSPQPDPTLPSKPVD